MWWLGFSLFRSRCIISTSRRVGGYWFRKWNMVGEKVPIHLNLAEQNINLRLVGDGCVRK